MVYKRRISKRKSVRKNRKGSMRRSSKKMRGGINCRTILNDVEDFEDLQEQYGDMPAALTECHLSTEAEFKDAVANERLVQTLLDKKAEEDRLEKERFANLSQTEQAEELELKANKAAHTGRQAQAARSFANVAVLARGPSSGRGRSGRGGGSRRRRGGGRGHGR